MLYEKSQLKEKMMKIIKMVKAMETKDLQESLLVLSDRCKKVRNPAS
jgi:hypothetical protein